MTPNQIETVKDSFQQISQDTNAFSLTFYNELFRMAPSLRGHFPTDMEDQRIKLAETLGAVVLHMHRLHLLEDTIMGLARRHLDYGAKPQHFAPVGAALIFALNQHTPNGLTPIQAEAWATAYGAISDLMIEAMVNAAA
ncbi:globin domain-containing protein [Yoonia sp. BS5-3]|uniref:Globin domain-containing protein n=1 Tax=Yoonia phaeophyticola TaxID=3137369 RepID=A0ABZ2V7P0_9RHOB